MLIKTQKAKLLVQKVKKYLPTTVGTDPKHEVKGSRKVTMSTGFVSLFAHGTDIVHTN